MLEIGKEKGKYIFEVKHFLYILSQLWEGCLLSQNIGITNRDIKPENIIFVFVDNEINKKIPTFKIADWGEGLVIDKKEEKSRKNFGLVGTPLYMAPE
jgi:serine/threonine protein kinase